MDQHLEQLEELKRGFEQVEEMVSSPLSHNTSTEFEKETFGCLGDEQCVSYKKQDAKKVQDCLDDEQCVAEQIAKKTSSLAKLIALQFNPMLQFGHAFFAGLTTVGHMQLWGGRMVKNSIQFGVVAGLRYFFLNSKQQRQRDAEKYMAEHGIKVIEAPWEKDSTTVDIDDCDEGIHCKPINTMNSGIVRGASGKRVVSI